MNCDWSSPVPWPDRVWDTVCGDAKKDIPHCGNLCQIPVLGCNILEAVGLFNNMGEVVLQATQSSALQNPVLVMTERSLLIAKKYLTASALLSKTCLYLLKGISS